jgi:phosphoadenosine phosphosulfate reductase
MNTEEIKKAILEKSPQEVLAFLAQNFKGEIIFSTSFGWEDQVLSDMIFAQDLPVKVFTLETGRLFPETYYTWNRTLERYQKPIHAFYPVKDKLEKMVSTKGPSSFYESVENRKECCGIRKIEPLNRALKGQKIWITGIRAEQSVDRENMDWVEWDEAHQLVKVHPIFNWTLEEVKAYINEKNVPYNPLHDKGFPSIGCQPCTRAVQPGEDFRAGRWWWEDQSKKECGLHDVSGESPQTADSRRQSAV